MNIFEAIEALKAGKKVRLTRWRKGSWVEYDSEKRDIIDNEGRAQIIFLNATSIQNEEWEIYEESILDDKEKEYLSAVIKPFRNRTKGISKESYTAHKECEYILIALNNMEIFTLPLFAKGSMYKGMKVSKDYSMEELGL